MDQEDDGPKLFNKQVSDVKRSRRANNSSRSRRSTKEKRVIKKRPRKQCTCSNCLKQKLTQNSKSCQFTNFVLMINRRVETVRCEREHQPERAGAAAPPQRRAEDSSNKITSPPPSNTASDYSFCSSLRLDHEPMG